MIKTHGLFKSKQIECKECSKMFLVQPHRLGRTKYCSKICCNLGKKKYSSWNKGLNKNLDSRVATPWKGKKRPELSGEKHHFFGVLRLDMMGDKNPNWKGGNSKGYKNGYYSTKYKSWRTSVFQRDNFTCQHCNFKGSNGYITAHHIKSFAYFPELRFEISNGQTLCEPCHSKTDNYKGRAKKQLLLTNN